MHIPPSSSYVSLIECPRDAMQGWPRPISTQQKIRYINTLLNVGFDTIDFGSFVSPKAVPQMADTKEVVPQLNMADTSTRLLAIVANVKGAEDAVAYDQIHYLGFPFSVSETFQRRNTNSTIRESMDHVEEIQNLCIKNNKELVLYLSMGFGNPYGDLYNEDIVSYWTEQLIQTGVEIISVADTVGLATPDRIFIVLSKLIQQYPSIEIGAHLHSAPANWKEKISAALRAGCRRLDGALKGIGGCPFAEDELVGNINTEWMIPLLQQEQLLPVLNETALQQSLLLATELFT